MDRGKDVENQTGLLFGQLWSGYDQNLFDKSVTLFSRRLDNVGFDLDWFKAKTVLDAGCGGGRNSIAISKLGAKEVKGIDVGEEGLVDARQRSQGVSNVIFKHASILDIPFEDEMFDMVWCAGVLHHTIDEEKALDELTRCHKKDGYLYLLVYASGGLRWPLTQSLRPLANHIGLEVIDKAIKLSGISTNKRRTFLDDLFVPIIDFYHWNRLEQMLIKRGFHNIERFDSDCRLDHESDLESYRLDLEVLLAIFAEGDSDEFGEYRPLFNKCYELILSIIGIISWYEKALRKKKITLEKAMDIVIGQGHHRVLAVKG